MFATWRWKVRHAEQACDAGRLDEACQALSSSELRQFEPAQRLVTKLTSRLLHRVRQRLAARDWQGAWNDLAIAKSLAGDTEELLSLRYELVDCELSTAAQRLDGGDPRGAWTLLEELRRHNVATDSYRRLTGAVAEQLGMTRTAGTPVSADERTCAWYPPSPVGRDAPKSETTAMPASLLEAPFLLWVDAVGGYLVCPASKVVLGQAVAGNRVDVPIQGDLSRRHATLTRHGEGYILEPIQKVWVDGQLIEEPTLMSDGDEFSLGRTVRLRFRQPSVLSASARLELISRHRTLPAVDGVVLLAESCVLGPANHNHVVCRPWTRDVVLYRQDERLCCRSGSRFELNGKPCKGFGVLEGAARLVGEDFSLSIEQL